MIFTGDSVRAILGGRKTQSRRVIKWREFQPSKTPGFDWTWRDKSLRWHDVRTPHLLELCPHGVVGDRIWVRETFAVLTGAGRRIVFRATDPEPRQLYYPDEKIQHMKWYSPLFLARNESRITLEITEVRVERLQDITEEDARAEGVEPVLMRDIGSYPEWMRPRMKAGRPHRLAFEELWDEINGKRAGCAWADNPRVWVIGFKRVDAKTEAA
jgi:hypothetical protein